VPLDLRAAPACQAHNTRMIGARQAARRILAPLLPATRLLVRGPRSSRAIAVTFDDGPDARHTPLLLDLLAAMRLRATFFVVGCKARALPAIVRRMVAEGHAVGNHTYWHREPDLVSWRALLGEVRDTQALLEDLTGRPCPLFRPPKGRLDLRKTLALWKARQNIVLWNVDPRDYRWTSASQPRAWAGNYRPKPGQILLLHDDRPWAVELLPHIASLSFACGLDWHTIDRWLVAPGLRRSE